MNILFITTHFNTGGITSYVLTLGRALAKSGHKVWVVSSGGNCVPQLEASGIRHFQVNIRTKSEVSPKLWLNYSKIKDLLQKEDINIIHAQTRVTQVLGFFLSRETGVLMVTTCHGFFRPRWFRKMFPCWGRAVIAISKPVKQHLRDDFKVPTDQVHLIANGIDLEHFVMTDDQMRNQARQKWGMGYTPLIGIIARLSDVKGIDILIKAMPLILEQIPSAQLLIAGKGPEEASLKKLTLDLSLGAHVHFSSITDRPQELLCALDVFVMPSMMEGLGLSVMEAQACGIPVVASRIGGLIDLIEDGKSGYFVPVNDPAALAGRIIEVLRDPQLNGDMVKRARSNIEQHFSVEIMLQKTLELYEQYSRR